ncbi:MAG: hypothetical protein SGILL_004024 [Bacillariaceae sp.]
MQPLSLLSRTAILGGALALLVAENLHCLGGAAAVIEEQACDASVPRALLQGELITIDETRFAQHAGKYPPSDNKDATEAGDDMSYFVLNAEKSVLYVPNFLNETVADDLKEFCISGQRFVRSPIRGTGNQAAMVQENQVRTSESCTMVPAVVYKNSPNVQAMFAEDPMPPHVAKVAKEVDLSWDIAVRASKILGVNPETVEPLQIVRYLSPDAEYKLHHDHGGYYGKTTEHRPWTMLVFLSDVTKGGHTAFPKLDLEVVPRFGDAIIWSNVKPSEEDESVFVADGDMVHAGKPPADGSHKYAMNVWFGHESSKDRMQEGQW